MQSIFTFFSKLQFFRTFLLFSSSTSGCNGIFSRRVDFSSFNSLPTTRLNSYQVKVSYSHKNRIRKSPEETGTTYIYAMTKWNLGLIEYVEIVYFARIFALISEFWIRWLWLFKPAPSPLLHCVCKHSFTVHTHIHTFCYSLIHSQIAWVSASSWNNLHIRRPRWR